MPNAANTAEVARAAARGGARGDRGGRPAPRPRGARRAGARAPRSVLAAVGLPTDHAYMSFVEAALDGRPRSWCAAPATPASAATSWSARPTRRAAVGRAARAAGEPLGAAAVRAGRARHAAHRDGLPAPRPGHQPRRHPGAGRGCGWAVGWKKDAFWGKDALVAEKEEAGPRRVLRGLVAAGRGIPRPGMQVLAGDDVVGRGHVGDLLADAAQGRRAGAASPATGEGDEVAVDVRGRREVFTVTRRRSVEARPCSDRPLESREHHQGSRGGDLHACPEHVAGHPAEPAYAPA